MRRQPQQKRSKAAVDAIIQAGFISLSRHGLAHTTTVQVADIAGISPGTLYQYFNNKEAVYEAMERHFVNEIVTMLKELMPELIQIDIRRGVTLLLHRFSEMLLKDDSRYLKYIRLTIHMGRSSHAKEIEKTLMEIIIQYVMHHPELTRLGNIPVTSYIIINGGLHTIISYLSDPNPPISFEQLIEGLGNMAVSYINAGISKET